jgi:hypothetical protein
MARAKGRPTPVSKGTVDEVRMITTHCSSDSHSDCYQRAWAGRTSFRCVCPCHTKSNQLPLALDLTQSAA